MKLVRFLILVCLGLVCSLPLYSCGGSEGPGNDPFELYVLYPLAGLGDRSFSDNVYEGVVRSGLSVNFNKTEAMADDIDQAKEIYSAWIEDEAPEPELIIAVSSEFDVVVNQSPCDFNNRKLLFLDYELEPCEHTRNIIYKTYAPSFLAGVAAMEVSASKKASVLAGMDIDPVNEFVRGFIAGVEYAGGEVVETRYISETFEGFWSADIAKEMSDEMYETVDVIFPVAGGSNLGVFEAAKEAEGRYTFGIDSDQSFWGVTVILGSVVKYLDRSVEEAIISFADSTFETGVFHMGMEDGKTGFVINEQFAEQLNPVVEEAYTKAIAAEQADATEAD